MTTCCCFLVCVLFFCFSTNCADRSSVANTTIDQFFIPELHIQVGIDDVSAEASDPCLHQHKINIDFLYEHNLSMLIYIVLVTGSMPDQPKQKFQGGKEPMCGKSFAKKASLCGAHVHAHTGYSLLSSGMHVPCVYVLQC